MKSNIKFNKPIIMKLKSEISSKTLKANLRNLFRKSELNNLNYVTIYIRFQLHDVETKDFKSLGKKHVLNLKNHNDINNYINHLMDKFDTDFINLYNPSEIVQIYCFYYSSHENEYKSFQRKRDVNTRRFFDEINHDIKSYLNFPFNNLYSSWGNIKITSKNEFIINNIEFNNDIESIKITEQASYNKVVYATIYFKAIDRETIQFIDKYMDDGYIQRVFTIKNKDSIVYSFNPNTFSPNFFIDKNVLPIEYNKDGERINMITEVKSNSKKEEEALKKGKLYTPSKFKAITLDIETYLDDSIFRNKYVKTHKLLAICFFDGVNSYKFYRNDYTSDIMMLTQCFNKLLLKKYHNYNIYIHNGANFDLNFLVEYLINRNGIKLIPIYKDNKFLSIDIQFSVESNKKDIFTIKIKDSYLLLLHSLSALGKAFNTDIKKTVYPYSFPNNNNLNYIGAVPEYSEFDSDKVNYNEYLEYKSKFLNQHWNLKNETLNYCVNDCISLYQILVKFRNLIEEKFDVDIQTCPTIASLAFKIFKSNYYNSKDNAIPLLTKEIYQDLKPWFFGGHVDVYTPSAPKENGSYLDVITKFKSLVNKSIDVVKSIFKLVRHYDVNSLYPYVMSINKYPTDIICKFTGNIKESNYKDLYDTHQGIYKVKLDCPDLDHPLLPIKIKGTTIYGYGDWTGYYFSEELKNAEKYGYTFEIQGGYIFESKYLFKDYVDSLYEIKERTPKSDPMYLISKMLLNNLFGRFGLDPWLGRSEFMTKSTFQNNIELGILDRSEVEEVEFTNHVLVTYPSTDKFGLQAYLPIAMAVTAFARVYMSVIKNNPLIRLLYTDTDSGFIIGELPSFMVDNKALGKWKLEDEYIYCIFLAPKMYACLNTKGESYSKVKGYKKTIPIEILSNFLNTEYTKEFIQTKWFKYINLSKINVDENSKYKLRVTDLKRNLIYDGPNLVGTSNIKIVSSSKNPKSNNQ